MQMICSGSYLESDVRFLLQATSITPSTVEDKERAIQENKKHYSEMISEEYIPSKEYMELFYQLFEQNKDRLAYDILKLANYINNIKHKIVLVSLARAGTPVGVLLKRTLEKVYSRTVPHYSISIIRDRGIDTKAIDYIRESHPDYQFVFIDGWTAKGIIAQELSKYIAEYNKLNHCNIDSSLYVISDLSGLAAYAANNDDYFIPSSGLNSTISGLISRSILNKEIEESKGFHGAIYYKKFESIDISLWYIETILKIIIELNNTTNDDISYNNKSLYAKTTDYIDYIMGKYSLSQINHIKPGIGECTRVLLRRSPKLILVKSKKDPIVQHILLLANNLKVEVKEDIFMPYSAVGIIKEVK